MPPGADGLREPRNPATRRVRIALALILSLSVVVRAAHFAAVADSVLPRVQMLMPNGDMAAHWIWSSEILDGDLLGRKTFHHETSWMREIAPIETWYRWWGGSTIFYREPLYPYFLALVRGVFRTAGGPDSPLAVLGVQLALSALAPLLLFHLGRRLLDERAGLLAAAGAAVYGPFVFYGSTLLRDWIPPLLDPLLLLALLRALERQRLLAWSLAGLLFGACLLVRSSLLLFLPLCAAWIVWQIRREPRAIARSSAGVAGGLLLALCPLVARNLAVGAPALALTNRGPEGIVLSNAPDSIPVAMRVPPSLPVILESARGSTLRAAIETVRAYEGRWDHFLRVQWIKLFGAFDARDHADNLDYEYGRSVSPVLSWLLGFPVVGLLGVAGLLLALRGGPAHALLVLYVLASLAGQLVCVVSGRYRLALAAVLLATGSFYAITCWDRLRAREWRRALPALAILPALLSAYLLLRPRELRDPTLFTSGRPLEPSLAAQVYAAEGRFEDALLEARRFREQGGTDHPRHAAEATFMEGFVRCMWAEDLIAAGRIDDARAQVNLARDVFTSVSDRDPSAWFQLGRLFLALGDHREAEGWLQRYLREIPPDQVSPSARALLDRARAGATSPR